MLKETKLRYVGHLGSIFFNFSMIGIIAVFGVSFMPVLWLILVSILLAGGLLISLFSIGTIWTSTWFKNFMVSSFKTLFSETTLDLMSKSVSYIPLIASISGATILITITLLIIDRNRPSSKNKLIAMIIVACIFIGLIIYLFSKNVFGLGK